MQSPYWLMRHGKSNASQKAVAKLLGPARKHKHKIILHEIETSINNQKQGSLFAQVNFMNYKYSKLFLLCKFI